MVDLVGLEEQALLMLIIGFSVKQATLSNSDYLQNKLESISN